MQVKPIARIIEEPGSSEFALHKFKRSASDPDLDDFMQKWLGIRAADLPKAWEGKVRGCAEDYAANLAANNTDIRFELDEGVAWLVVHTRGEGEYDLANLRWKVSDLLNVCGHVHPDEDGGELATALSQTFLAMHLALERALKASNRKALQCSEGCNSYSDG